MAKNEFIPHKFALEVENLGFNSLCLAWYRHDGFLKMVEFSDKGEIPFYYNNKNVRKFLGGPTISKERLKLVTTAPTYNQIFNWFREQDIDYSIITHYNGDTKSYRVKLTYKKDNELYDHFIYQDEIIKEFSSIEEVYEDCLESLINIYKDINK